MTTILIFCKILFGIFSMLTLIGLIRPWWVLWFLDEQNRWMVIKYYGRIALISGICILLLLQIT
ncbi:MAG TPA: hypothetical protein DDY13_11545 [Cytophagales bacterium]|nr:hypothetical protein [Cytophagales bacterium]